MIEGLLTLKNGSFGFVDPAAGLTKDHLSTVEGWAGSLEDPRDPRDPQPPTALTGVNPVDRLDPAYREQRAVWAPDPLANVLVVGFNAVNRAFHGDVVAVELLPVDQ